MRSTIDAGGRVVIPKPMRDELGLRPGDEVEVDSRDGRVEISAPSRVRLENGPRGPRLVADGGPTLTADDVRAITERTRR